MKTVRFWTYLNGGPVRLSLAEGQTLHHWQGRRTDEGWEGEGHTWTLDHGVVHLQAVSDGCDCDGRLTRWREGICPVRDLAKVGADNGIDYPAWQDADAGQIDATAEAAGY